MSESHSRHSTLASVVAVLGIVYGDIGTSPLYAFRECFEGTHHVAIDPANVTGILSLIFWSLILIISVKYLIFILRADNNGEGGILALMALLRDKLAGRKKLTLTLLTLGLFGSALLYADALITPAISILSAVEGLSEVNPGFTPWVIPVALIVMLFLFLFQRHGTSKIGLWFGPVMVVWFASLGAIGIYNIIREPAVLEALNPWRGIHFVLTHGVTSLGVLGSLFLVVTGGEALYADMGHFNARVIRLGWFWLVLPCLVLDYFGQGAYLLQHQDGLQNLFYVSAPQWALMPLLVLATAATVIASQAIITGTYSLTSQAVQLGFSPRLAILQTSSESIGQIYLPLVNWALMIGCVALVLVFKHSGALAEAYGLAVSGTMLITTVLFFFVTTLIWKWPKYLAVLLLVVFLGPDLTFFVSNSLKIPSGGWLPLVIGVCLFGIMKTWHSGRNLLGIMLRQDLIKNEDFVQDVKSSRVTRVPGTAVFLTANRGAVPRSLLHNFKHNKVLHKVNVFLTIITETVPHVEESRRSEVVNLGEEFYVVTLHYGFRQNPDVPEDLHKLENETLSFAPMTTSYFLSRQTLVATAGRSGIYFWQKPLFSFMFRNALDPAKYFKIPANRVVELGEQLTF